MSPCGFQCCNGEADIDTSSAMPKPGAPPTSTQQDWEAVRRSDSQGGAAACMIKNTDHEILIFTANPDHAADTVLAEALPAEIPTKEESQHLEASATTTRPLDVSLVSSSCRTAPKNRGFFRRSGSNYSNNTANSNGSNVGRVMNRLSQGLRRSGSGASVASASTMSKNSRGDSNNSGGDQTDKTNTQMWEQFFDLAKGAKQSASDPAEGEEAVVAVQDGERRLLLQDGLHVFPTSINAVRGGKPNMVRTTRFTLSTWLPKSLMAQFKRVANVYFLFITFLVCFLTAHPDYDSPKDWRSKVGPFVMVLFWTALKDLYEDKRRERDDRAVNLAHCTRYNHQSGDFETARWQDVLVGDILFIAKDEAFPADLILLQAAGSSDAFISTVMLDGESTLKDRRAPLIFEVLAGKVRHQRPQEFDDVVPQSPNAHDYGGVPEPLKPPLLSYISHMMHPGLLFKFASPVANTSDVRGSVKPVNLVGKGEGICPFTEANFLPRGCVLRNTPWVLALAMYSGDDTKTRLNSSKPAAKFSNMQKNLNICIRGLLILLLVICSAATILKEIGRGTFAVDTEEGVLVIFMMYWVKFYHVVPISLYLMYELMKLILIFQVNQDKQMVDPDTGEGAVGRTADLVEEMGQIDFIFSDKTGTLTKNEMVFARCHVSGHDYGDFRCLEKDTEPPGVTNVKRILARSKSDPQAEELRRFFTYLAVCHTVQVSSPTSDAPSYAGMSPDEVALVTAAQQVGVVLESRTRNTAGSGHLFDLVVRESANKKRFIKVLHEIPFNSDRKRMSVVVKIKGEVWCITKGADTVMESLLNAPLSSACQRDIGQFSRSGLRMLIVAAKKVDRAEYDLWTQEVADAKNLVDCSRDEKVAELQAHIETNLNFIGVTAVEDRLQDEVPETIQRLKDMGIRFWMLTGDKTETAVEIAKSCNLVDHQTGVVYVTGAKRTNHAEDLLLHAHSVLVGNPNAGLVLDGQSLQFALESPECRRVAVDVGLASRACVCTRMSPMQKMQLVKLVQDHDEYAITLGIGDGANDVPMIHKAHLGIAVRGKEGTQAVQASDVAISQFRFLVPLLACHGRRAYRRVATFLCFYLYKNVALLMADVLWLLEDKFGPDIAYPEYLSIGYNVCYSTWHVLLVLGFDRDMSDDASSQATELYRLGPGRELFNIVVFGKWVLTGIWHGMVMWILPLRIIGHGEDMLALYDKEVPSTFWVASATSFTCVNLIVNIKLILVSENPLSWITILPTLGAWALYFVALFMLGNTSLGNSVQPSLEGVPQETFDPGTKAPQALAITILVALSLDIVGKAIKYAVCPSPTSLARRRARQSQAQAASEAGQSGG